MNKFQHDLIEGQRYENNFINQYLKGYTNITKGNNADYDIKAISPVGEEETFEVKTDFGVHKTGNFYVEYKQGSKDESQCRLSGIAISKAEYYVLIGGVEKVTYLIPTSELKDILRNGNFRRVPNAINGDCPTWGLLLKAISISKYKI